MNAQHAPGPWTRDKYGHVLDANGDEVRFRSLTILASSGSEERMAEAERNTDLAAAAAEMLDALRRAVVTLAGVLVHAPELGVRKDYEIVSAAIAKATGAPPQLADDQAQDD